MHFDECAVGDYRVYAGAIEAPGGWVAAVVVNRMRGPAQSGPKAGEAAVLDGPREAFRDTSMSGGHRWPSPSAALSYALKQAAEIIEHQPQKLIC